MNLIKALKGLFPQEPEVPFPEDTHRERRTQWERQREERNRNIPHGLALCYSIGQSLEDPIALSPGGQYVTSGAKDATLRLWDPSAKVEVKRLRAHSNLVSSVAWSPSGGLVSGANDTTIRLWDVNTGEEIRALTGHSRTVCALAWSPDGSMLASGAEDKSVRIWDIQTGLQHHLLLGHPRNVRCVAWSHDGKILASGGDSGQMRLWNAETGALNRAIDAHANGVSCVAWSPTKPSLLASGGNDATVRLWNTETGQQMHRLENHTKQVTNLAFSADGRLLISQSAYDGAEVCFWRTDTWELVASLPINPFKGNFPLAFQTNPEMLLTGGDSEDEIRIWQVDIDVLLQGTKPTLQYSNAKVVLMGDSGVGKTGLYRVICGEPFRPTESTHGRHVFVLDNRIVAVNTQGRDEENGTLHERREILLWDLAGQPSYRVIHQLHLTEVTLALVVFDGHNETDPFAGVRHWDRALRQAQSVSGQAPLPLKKFLVAARVDRGGIGVGTERIDEMVQELGFDGYIETSSKEGYNIKELREIIKTSIAWDSLPRVTSNELFETIKSFLLQSKQHGHILTRTPDLYNALVSSSKGDLLASSELRAQFDRCISLVESRDLIMRFRFGNFILLQPELLDAYASALVNSVRDEPDGLGSILESRVKQCQFRMPADERIPDKEQEMLLLLAMIEDLLRHELALLERTPEGNYLVFPSQSTRVNYELPDPEGKALIFEFEGPVQNIYATLAVRLSRSELFQKKDLWKDAVTYSARVGGQCGMFLQNIGEGRGRLTLFFDSKATEETRFHFEDYIAKHLQRHAIHNSVKRLRFFICPEPTCKETIPHSTVSKRRERGFDWLICSNCGTRVDLSDGAERLTGAISSQILEMDYAADSQRNLDVLRSTRHEEQEISARQGKKISRYDVFLCYNTNDKPLIKQIANHLLEKNVFPWLDEWEVPHGQDWHQVLKEHLMSISTAAVFVDKDSLAPWHDPQQDELLRTFAKKHSVVPVILPECEKPPQLPDYITGSWIDMRISEPDPFEALIERLYTK